MQHARSTEHVDMLMNMAILIFGHRFDNLAEGSLLLVIPLLSDGHGR